MFHVDTLVFTLGFLGMGYCGWMIAKYSEYEGKATFWRLIFFLLFSAVLYTTEFTLYNVLMGAIGGIVALCLGIGAFLHNVRRNNPYHHSFW